MIGFAALSLARMAERKRQRRARLIAGAPPGWMARLLASLALAGLIQPASAQQYERVLSHSVAPCQGRGPAVWLHIVNIKNARGLMRIHLYLANKEDWLARGRWLHRIEVPAKAGQMQICMPVPGPGDYAIAMRHDANENNDTDVFGDGGGMSGNPRVNIFNMGRPSVDRTRFTIGNEVLPMTIRMRYF